MIRVDAAATIGLVDVTPQLLKDVEFREKFRGYDPDEVDDFLERVGLAIGQLQQRLRDATERAESADARASDEDPSETEETLRRTLLLAQRTADAAVQEAEAKGTRTVEEAEQRAAELLADAEGVREKARSKGEAEARLAVYKARIGLTQETVALEERRDALKADLATLHQNLESQRERIGGALASVQGILDDPGGLGGDREPETVVEDLLLPVPVEPAIASHEPNETPFDQLGVSGEDLGGAQPQQDEPPPPQPSPPPPLPSRPAGLPGGFGGLEGPRTDEPVAPLEPLAPLDRVATDSPVPDPDPPDASGDEEESGGDAFLAELRKAMDDDTPLGPREEADDEAGTSFHELDDEAATAFYEEREEHEEHEEPRRPRSWPGRRR